MTAQHNVNSALHGTYRIGCATVKPRKHLPCLVDLSCLVAHKQRRLCWSYCNLCVVHSRGPLQAFLQMQLKKPQCLLCLDRLPTVMVVAGQTALVFGREESGLTEAELRLCAHSCAIPTGRIQGSMNLSHAVAVVLSGLFERRLQLLGLANLGIEVSGGLHRDGRSACTGSGPLGGALSRWASCLSATT
eukprot:GHRQ01032333.1.p1 GENE.GHRQ01032333.1~~GHRQ01032333.1.p1  ORF type:complete len:189 (-),score=22.38 GHRQ01032333.1:96-662(-)